MRKLLFNYYFNKLDYTASPELLHDVAERSDGFNVRSIQAIVQAAYSFAQVRRSSQMSIDDICAAFYYDQKIKLPDMDMRARILKYYIKQKPHNIVEGAALDKIVLPIAQDTIDNFTGKELKLLVENAFDTLETDRKTLFDENNCLYYLYIGLYKELLKKAEPFAITAVIRNDAHILPAGTYIRGPLDELAEVVKLQDKDKFNEHITLGHSQGRCNYLDFANIYKPTSEMRRYLIAYLLSKSGIKLTNEETKTVSTEIEGLSCYAIKEVIEGLINYFHAKSIKKFDMEEFKIFVTTHCRVTMINRILQERHKQLLTNRFVNLKSNSNETKSEIKPEIIDNAQQGPCTIS